MVIVNGNVSAVSGIGGSGLNWSNVIIVVAILIVLYFVVRLLIKFLSREKPIKQKDIFKQINVLLNTDLLFNRVPKKAVLNFSNGVKVKILSHSIDRVSTAKDKDTADLIDIFKVRIKLKALKVLDAFVFLSHEYVSMVGVDYIARIENVGFKALGNLIIQNDILTDTNNYIKEAYIFRNDYTTILNEYENANLHRAVVSDIETAKAIKIDKEHLELFTKLLNNKNFQQINSMINK